MEQCSRKIRRFEPDSCVDGGGSWIDVREREMTVDCPVSYTWTPHGAPDGRVAGTLAVVFDECSIEISADYPHEPARVNSVLIDGTYESGMERLMCH